MERKLTQTFRILLSVLFVFSSLAKIVDLPFFDKLVAELLIGDDYLNSPTSFWWIQVLTRAIISGELILGVAILGSKYIKMPVVPAMFGLVVLFTLHLIYEGSAQMADGKTFTEAFREGNCGCFGKVLPMTILESIIKNLVTLGLVGYVWKTYNERKRLEFRTWIPPIVIGLTTFFTLSFTIVSVEPLEEGMVDFGDDKNIPKYESKYPVKNGLEVGDTLQHDSLSTDSLTSSNETNEQSTEQAIHSSTVAEVDNAGKETAETTTVKKPLSPFAKFRKWSGGVTADLDQGDKLVCMFSLSCGHCQAAYKDIVNLAKEGKCPPAYLIVFGSEGEVDYFFQQAGGKHPYILLENFSSFSRILDGSDYPKILHRVNGSNLKDWDLETYSKQSLNSYFGGSQTGEDAPDPITTDPSTPTLDIPDGSDGFGGGGGMW